MVKITHKWHFGFTPRAKRAFEKLPSSTDRMGVFTALEEILKADDPTRTKKTAQFQAESGTKVWRKHADNYRIFFVVDSTEIEVNRHFY